MSTCKVLQERFTPGASFEVLAIMFDAICDLKPGKNRKSRIAKKAVGMFKSVQKNIQTR